MCPSHGLLPGCSSPQAVLTHQSELGLSNKEAEGIKALQARAMLSVAGAMCSRLSWLRQGSSKERVVLHLCPQQCSLPDRRQTMCILQYLMQFCKVMLWCGRGLVCSLPRARPCWPVRCGHKQLQPMPACLSEAERCLCCQHVCRWEPAWGVMQQAPAAIAPATECLPGHAHKTGAAAGSASEQGGTSGSHCCRGVRRSASLRGRSKRSSSCSATATMCPRGTAASRSWCSTGGACILDCQPQSCLPGAWSMTWAPACAAGCASAGWHTAATPR